jgi:hypothetical protein
VILITLRRFTSVACLYTANGIHSTSPKEAHVELFTTAQRPVECKKIVLKYVHTFLHFIFISLKLYIHRTNGFKICDEDQSNAFLFSQFGDSLPNPSSVRK